ncbi:hypothetical protein SKAU_G00423800 [Synaphobranchus kaupii]|uniref:C2H2-type domain-containing protein n=1 Tax=Synaphobranchus kaupii TaxID=118154 RepID=A0A9Q1E5G8_SYNKA|nr:hypothetical protein SKAU_G00423800 [Synaphobranchus kaupii]
MVSLRLLCLVNGHLQEMSTCASFQVQMASIMQVLTKTAVEEITKLVDDGSAALRLEMCRSQRENEALRRKLLLMERELGSVRGYGEGAPDNSLNIAFEVQFCDEFTEVQRPKVPRKGSVSSVFDERLSTGPAKDNQNVLVEKNRVSSDALDIKYEPADGEQDWPEYLLLNEDRLEDGPGRRQSQMEQKISEENTCGTLGAACADGGAGPLCEQPCPAGDPEKGLQAELKQEPEGEPVTPALPQLKVQCAWTEADGGSGTVQEKQGQPGGSSEHGGAWFAEGFVPPKRRASRRLRSVTDKGLTSHHGQQQNGGPLAEEHCRWLADDISAEMAFPLGSPGEPGGSTPCEASFDTLTEAQEQHGSGKLFSSLESGEGFTSSRVLEKHQRIHSRKKPFACSWNIRLSTQGRRA